LPTQLTQFIGREQEITEVHQLLKDHRLVTLVGAGGSGKTRMAIEAASRRISAYQDGIRFVGLADLTEPDLVLQAVALALGLKESPGVDLIDGIKNFIQAQSMLLLLDNCEHLLLASSDLADQLLHTCPNLQILATSRQALGVLGESVYPVPGLAVPSHADPAALEDSEAVKLFLDRTRLVQPHYLPSDDSLLVIGEICRQLDGVPLELAAARMKILSPRQVLARLSNQFSLLNKTIRGVPERHQTLQAVVDWSYNLLISEEKVFFNRLAVFRGGCTLEAAEAIGTGEEIDLEDVLDILASLADKSMIFPEQSKGRGVRYRLLETLRQFGLDRLRENGELDSVRKRHALYYLALMESAAQELQNRGRAALFEELESDHDNLRAALDWALIAEDGTELGLRLAGAMRQFWETRGYLREGRERTEAALKRSGSKQLPLPRAGALEGIAWLAYRQSDYQACRKYADESLALCRFLDYKPGIADSLIILGNVATEEGDYPTASTLMEEALAIRRELDDRPGIAHALMNLGWAAMRPGDNQTAEHYLSEALAIYREADNRHRIAMVLSGLGEAALREGKYDKAVELLEESLEWRVELGDKWGMGVCHGSLGWAAMAHGDLLRAGEHFRKSLKLRSDIGDKGGTAWCLEKLAEMAINSGQDEQATRLFGAAAELRASINSVIDPVDQPEYHRKVELLRQRMGDDRFKSWWAEGESLSLEEVMAYAISEAEELPSAKKVNSL
jgi:non-specific serine/threonine protein kinase